MKNIISAVILGIALASVSFAQTASGPMRESMDTMKKAWRDASFIQTLIDALIAAF